MKDCSSSADRRASPRSHILRSQFAFTSRLFGFRSLCVRVCVCDMHTSMHACSRKRERESSNTSERESSNTSIPYTATAKDLVSAKIKIKSRETKPVHDVRRVQVLEPAKDLVGEIPHVVVWDGLYTQTQTPTHTHTHTHTHTYTKTHTHVDHTGLVSMYGALTVTKTVTCTVTWMVTLTVAVTVQEWCNFSHYLYEQIPLQG